MKDNQFKMIMDELQRVKSEAADKGHFFVIVLLICLAMEVCGKA